MRNKTVNQKQPAEWFHPETQYLFNRYIAVCCYPLMAPASVEKQGDGKAGDKKSDDKKNDDKKGGDKKGGDKKNDDKKSEPPAAAQEPVLNFKSNKINEDLRKKVIELYKKHKNAPTLPGVVEVIKKDLDVAIPKGWVVFAGKHLVGACSFIKDTMVEFEVDGTAFVIFQTYCPV